jgi:hypothetical protein
MNKNKIPAVMVSNIYLRNALIEALKKSNHNIDYNYIGIDMINNPRYGAFVLNDTRNMGAGLAYINKSETEYDFITIDEMFELLIPTFVPVEVKLNSEYTAVIQQDGTFKVGCQTFTKDILCKLLLEIEKVQAKN